MSASNKNNFSMLQATLKSSVISRITRLTVRGTLFTLAIVVLAAILRIWPLRIFASSVPWLTFYPAIMITAMVGGLLPGIITTISACLIVTCFWSILVTQPFITTFASEAGVFVFAFNGLLISIICEALHFANRKSIGLYSKLRTITDNVPVYISYLDREHYYRYANNRYTEIFQIPLQQIINRHCRDVLGDDYYETAKEKINKALSGEAFTFESSINIKSKGVIAVEISYIPDFDKSNIVSGIFVLVHDITDRKKVQEERREMQNLLQASKLASIGMLAAGVAHEINNPLAILKGNISLMQDNGDEKMAQILGRQDKAVDRIARIVKALNIYARNDEGGSPVRIDVHQALSETLELIIPLFQKENIEFDCRLNASKFVIDANVGSFQQILMNLLTNARDSFENKQNSKRIVIESKTNSGRLEISVADSGCGMTTNVLTHIFDPFFTTKPPGKGAGIGLSICQSLIGKMGGTISVKSEIEKGSIFTVSFPIAANLSMVAPAAAEQINKKRFTGRVLIVDDEDDVRVVMKRFLNELGLDVIEANDGDVALKIMQVDANIQFLITDINMPKMSGNILIRNIRNSGCANQAKIIVVTGRIDTNSEFALGDAPAIRPDAYLMKPFGPADLEAVLRNAVTTGSQKAA